jgi:hypothetical protein
MIFKKAIPTSSSFHQQHSSSILNRIYKNQNYDRVAIQDENRGFTLGEILSESVRISEQIKSLIGKSTNICVRINSQTN